MVTLPETFPKIEHASVLDAAVYFAAGYEDSFTPTALQIIVPFWKPLHMASEKQRCGVAGR